MNANIKCTNCGATATVPYENDPDTGGGECNLDNAEWQLNNDLYEGTCLHDDYDIIDTEWHEPLMDDVI